MTDIFRISPRFEDDGRVLLVLPDLPARPGYLVCYSRIGQHSECTVGYYRRKTTPAPHNNPSVLALTREWCNLGNPCAARFVQRIAS